MGCLYNFVNGEASISFCTSRAVIVNDQISLCTEIKYNKCSKPSSIILDTK